MFLPVGPLGCLCETSETKQTARIGCGARASFEARLARRGLCSAAGKLGSNLVDSASSHTLVSKIKPCTSKYKSFTLKLRMAHYISYSLFDSPLLFG